MEVVFRQKYPWALVPYRCKINRADAQEQSNLYTRSFRWLRRNRVPELCWPWRLGAEVGWMIPSPVDITMTPFSDVEVACPEADLDFFGRATGLTELWSRGETYLAIEKVAWLRLYEVKVDDGWQAMFVPNGGGTIEWHLGWEVEIPERYYLLVVPTHDIPSLEVPSGMFDAATLLRLNKSHGLSIAARPIAPVHIRRGQPIAKIILLHETSLKIHERIESYEGP